MASEPRVLPASWRAAVSRRLLSTQAPIASEAPPETDSFEGWQFAAVEAVRIGSGHAGVEHEMRGAVIASPVTGGGKQSFTDAPGTVRRVDCQLVEPGSLASA